jgi:hypothetical protein
MAATLMKQYTTVQRPLPTGRYINLQRLHNVHTINQPDTTLRSLIYIRTCRSIVFYYIYLFMRVSFVRNK